MRCLLHIGSNKTGSSSIQATLARRTRMLRAAGILYPLTGRRYESTTKRHVGLYAAAAPNSDQARHIADRLGQSGPTACRLRQNFSTSLEAEISGSTARLAIFSDEALFKYAAPEVAKGCIGLLEPHFDNIKVIAYLRAPDRLCESSYVQAIKTGSTLSLEEYVGYFIAQQRGYASTLDIWADVVGTENICAVPFPEGDFDEGVIRVLVKVVRANREAHCA